MPPQGKSQYETALRELRSLILRGEFEPNSRLPEVALADRLGVSRTPLRQAMACLVEERLLERIRSGGCRVASFSMDDIVDAIEVRGVLEGTAARIAAERGITPELATATETVLEALDAAIHHAGEIDFERYVPLNAEFHRLLSHMPGSRTIEREVERARSLPLASPSAFLAGQETIPDFRESLLTAQRQHRGIFKAIVDREGSRAESLTREHARLARLNLDVVAADRALIERIPGMSLVEELAV